MLERYIVRLDPCGFNVVDTLTGEIKATFHARFMANNCARAMNSSAEDIANYGTRQPLMGDN